MCRFLLATIPPVVNLVDLEANLPERLRLSLLKFGLREPESTPEMIGFSPTENRALQCQLPTPDNIVRITRLHCDCWSTLATQRVSEKEVAKWRSIFERVLEQVERFGLLVHFGMLEDAFPLKGPVPLSLEQDGLFGLNEDTYYEVTLK